MSGYPDFAAGHQGPHLFQRLAQSSFYVPSRGCERFGAGWEVSG
jgi:hypothetical protein